MKFYDQFGGKYWKAADLTEPRLLTISRFEREAMMGNTADQKWVLYFEEDRRGLVLNQTNAEAIRTAYGDDSRESIGQRLVLFPTNTELQGRTVECIRVRKPEGPPSAEDIPY